VRYIVEGSVVPQEGTIRVNASLIDASNGTQIWTAELDRSRIGDVSADIAIPIAARLRLTLNQIETARSVSDRPDDPNALDLFFRARSRLDSSGSPKDLAAAEALLQGALEKQPDFADAQAELAWLLLRKETTTDDPDEAHDDALAKELIAKALAASPQNSQALVARAKWLQTAGNCAQAQAFANRVLAIDGSSLRAHAVLAGCAYAGNNLDAAARAYEAMIALNPDGPSTRQINLALGYIYLMQGALAHARLAFDAAEDPDELPDPTEWNPLEQSKVGKIAALWLQGDHEAARRAYADYASKWPSRDVWRITMLFPRAWLANAGTQHLLDALHSAGMPLFVSESAPGRPDQVCGDGEFALTPTTLAGGRLLETAALRARLGSQPAPLILDVGHGGAVLERAVWRNPASSDQAAADFALQAAADHTGGSTRTPIIVAGDGPFGCDGFKAAQALLAHGYVDVGWYRGGEEAWHAAGAGGSDLRTQ
jgi:tetratricopeptide (TPR) repeat protein